MSELSETVALITGASSGIGAATAKSLAADGATVVLAARREDRLQSVAETITDEGGEALVVPTDVTDDASIDSLVETVTDTYGRIDVLVNNAGVMLVEPLERADRSNLRQMVEVNLLGLMTLTHAVLPVMLDQESGHIVNVSSVAGRFATENFSGYNGTKFGVNGFTEALRQEVTTENIRTTVVEPGAVATELPTHITDEQILERFSEMEMPTLDADDIARAITYAVSQPAHVEVNELLIRPTGQV